MTRHANDRMIDNFLYMNFDEQRIYAGVYVSGTYYYIKGFWFYSETAKQIHDYLMNPDGSSTTMASGAP